MLTKIAKKIVNTMTPGLTGNDLVLAIGAALAGKTSPATLDKDTEAIRNEYVQHAWDVEDLTGATAKPTAKKIDKEVLEHNRNQRARTGVTKNGKKIAKPATKKAAKKPAAKKAKVEGGMFKTNEAGKRVGNDGKVIQAYPKPQGRTRVMFALVLAGASNADGLAFIQHEFKNAPTTISSLGWVRSQLRNNPSRWMKKYSSKDMKAVKADRDCAKMTIAAMAKAVDKFTPADDESEDE